MNTTDATRISYVYVPGTHYAQKCRAQVTYSSFYWRSVSTTWWLGELFSQMRYLYRRTALSSEREEVITPNKTMARSTLYSTKGQQGYA